MAAQRDRKPADTVDEQPPPYCIADQPLFIDYVRAHNPGDRVPVEHVERYGWADKVHTPDTSPAAGPQDEKTKPAAGQATTERNA